jgi:hypothetical protein
MATYDARPSAFTQLALTSDWESMLLAGNVPDGIDNSTAGGSAMAPSLDTAGRNAVIQAGNVLIRGQLWRCDASVSTPIPGPSSQNRIDRLVLELNRGATTSPTVVQPVVITGTPSGTPVEPPLNLTPTGLYDIPVCSWTSQSTGGLVSLVDERQFSNDQWHNITSGLPSGISILTVCRYRMKGREVKLQFGLSVSPSASTANPLGLFTLPQNYAPANEVRVGGLGCFVYGATTVSALNNITSMRLDIQAGSGLVRILDWVGGANGTGVTELEWDGSYHLD